MRGKVLQTRLTKIRHRITPAYAGKRRSVFGTICSSQDHPRLCGEKLKMPVVVNDGLGSPPPMRGKAIDLNRVQDIQ